LRCGLGAGRCAGNGESPARLNRNGYPEGYAPKRATQVMPKLPTTPDELQALHAFLNSF
jgi:hypothetical protein